ncbi:MAG TPA: tetratricopeptide repeat protein [Gemmataceae bacterium]|nr:tetratricopeptide repeat protein [Gemmataceae bacterium]
MRHLCPSFFVLSLVAPAFAADPALQEARQLWLRGSYEQARVQYEKLAATPQHKPAATIGVSRAWESQGQYDKALAVIDAALAELPKDGDLHARRAELLYGRGRWEEAEKAANQALEFKKESFAARWVLAQIYRDRGDVKKADSDFRWFVRTYSQRSDNDKDITDPDELLIVGLAGAENARWHSLSDQFEFILNTVFDDALKADKEFWPADYQAGMLLLEKYNLPGARKSFANALKINPSAAEVLIGMGLAALQKYEIKDAEQFAQRALKINPHLPEALRLRSDLHLMAGNRPAALSDLEQARKVNPRDESTLGRIAACLLLDRKNAEFDALARDAEKHDPKAGVFYFELAERLEERRQFDAAEKYFKKSIELRPNLPWPKNGLGMLYMRMGREKDARDILTRAFKEDEFNVRVANTLKVLRHLDTYETIKTEHFELRFDPKKDKIFARYMADYLEQVYADLAAKFQYHPPVPILYEVFNNHEMFSGRVVALPDLHTIGASTGRMVAMVSPRAKEMGKPFNWGRVVRHELVHIFNLEQTKFLCPHWLTEGLAVINEGFARPQQWNQLLLQRVPAGELMNLDSIDLGFIRPRSPLDWHMAYCQSQLYVEYMKDKYGALTPGQLLQAYADGLDTTAAISKVCKVDKATFEKGYRAHLDKVVQSLGGKPAEKPKDFKTLRQEHEDKPDDPEIAARLAEQYLLRRRNTEARRLVDKVLAKNMRHPLAAYVKARLLLQAGEEDQARKLLEESLDRRSPDSKILQALGKLYFEAKEFPKAVEICELGRKTEPYESKWLTDLARIYAQTGDKDNQIAILKELAPADADDLDVRRRLAQMLLDANRPAEAERFAREALEIDVLDGEAQAILEKALVAQKKTAEAEKLRKLLRN